MSPYIGIVAIIFFIKAVTYFSGEIRAWTFFFLSALFRNWDRWNGTYDTYT